MAGVRPKAPDNESSPPQKSPGGEPLCRLASHELPCNAMSWSGHASPTLPNGSCLGRASFNRGLFRLETLKHGVWHQLSQRFKLVETHLVQQGQLEC